MSMTPQDRQAIESVFDRLKQVETQGAPRDAEAEQFIQERLQGQPGAAYYMAQTILIQEQALQKAQAQMQQSSSRQPAQSQSLSDGGFGRQSVPGIGTRLAGGAEQQGAGAAPAASNLSGAGFGRNAGGGGFMAGALQTAVGVAGGLMLGNMLTGLFGGNDAQAGEVPPEDAAADAPADESHADDGGAGFDDAGFDDGGDFGEI